MVWSSQRAVTPTEMPRLLGVACFCPRVGDGHVPFPRGFLYSHPAVGWASS